MIIVSKTQALGCPECKSTVGGNLYNDWCCLDCGAPMRDQPPTLEELGLDPVAEKANWEARKAAEPSAPLGSAGSGDWENHEIFQLRGDDPLRYEARSLADYNAILRKRGYDPDTHRPDLSNPKWGLAKEQ